MGHVYSLTSVSKNKKTGPIPVTTTSADSCPDNCPLKGAGCYGNYGPLYLHWKKVTEGVRGVALDAFVQALKRLPFGSLIRHNQVGDLPGEDDILNEDECLTLTKALTSHRKVPFTYTHYPRTKENLSVWKRMLSMGFAVNASNETLDEADESFSQGLPTTVILPSDFTAKKTMTPKGVPVYACPAQLSDRLQCANCGGSQGPLCTRINRDFIVGFYVHGTQKKAANAAIKAKEVS